jgi:hypothetical protein
MVGITAPCAPMTGSRRRRTSSTMVCVVGESGPLKAPKRSETPAIRCASLAARTWPSDDAIASMIAWTPRLRSWPMGSSSVRGRSCGPNP